MSENTNPIWMKEIKSSRLTLIVDCYTVAIAEVKCRLFWWRLHWEHRHCITLLIYYVFLISFHIWYSCHILANLSGFRVIYFTFLWWRESLKHMRQLLVLFRACSLVRPYSIYTSMASSLHYQLLVYALMEQPGSSSYPQGVVYFVALYATSFTQPCNSRACVLTPIGTVLYHTFPLGSPIGVK